METLVRLDAVRCAAFDAHLVRLGPGKLTRAAAGTYLESAARIDLATCQLGAAGVRVTPCSTIATPSLPLRPALAADLSRRGDMEAAVDVVEFRPVTLGDASALLMRRRHMWLWQSRVAREACRRLLREEDAILEWRRVVWMSITALRASRARERLRPVVFDRGAIERQPLRWTYVSLRAIERWAFA